MVASASIAAGTVVPVFPLPGTVFFPGTLLPLNVFEPRYRAMVRDAAASDRLIAMALLRPGWESDYAGRPPIHTIGTVGRIEQLEHQDDGRYHMRLAGLTRVRFDELTSTRPYRLAQVIPLEETSVVEDDATIERVKLDLLVSRALLRRELEQDCQLGPCLDEHRPFEIVTNETCASLPISAAQRQHLLEENDIRRRASRAAAVIEELIEGLMRLRRSDEGSPEPLGLN